MDKLLWETLANVLTLCITQVGFIADAVESGEDGADTALAHRIGMIKQIQHELGRAVRDFEAVLAGDGADDGIVHDLSKLADDFSQFLQNHADKMD